MCTIGDERVSLRRAGDAAKADAAAARVRRPTVRRTAATPGAGPTETLTFTTPQPQPGGVRPRVLDPGPRRPLGRHPVAPAPRPVARPCAPGAVGLPRLRLPGVHRGLRRPARARADPRPAAGRRGRRRHPRALPQRALGPLRPGAHHAPARGEVQPRVRRDLPRRLHPRGRVRRAGRGVHLHLGVHARQRRRVALPRPRPQPHAEHVPRPVRRDRRPREGARSAPDVEVPLFLHAARSRRSPACAAQFQCFNGRAYAGNTPTIKREGRPGRRAARVRDGQQLPRLPHPRPPLEGRSRGVRRHARRSGPTRPIDRRASSRTTPAAGCTTATSSPTRTRGMTGWYLVEP